MGPLILSLMLSFGAMAQAADDAAGAAPADEAERSPASPDEASTGGAGSSQGPDQKDACIDENVKADLFAKRRMRTTRDRLFQQTNRHELTVHGGYYSPTSSTARSPTAARTRIT